MRLNLTRDFYIPKDAVKHKETDLGVVYRFTAHNGKPAAIAFKGKSAKPVWRFWFGNEEQMESRVKSFFDGLESWRDYKTEQKQKRAAEIAQHEIKPGDYFYHSWGYDQTNIDYIVVVSVTDKTAICKCASPIHVGESGQQDVLMPGTAYGRSFRLKISGKDSLTGSYPYCDNDQSYTMRGYFSKTSLGSVHYQTNPVFGH